MATTNELTLQQEWDTLHRDHERYDQYGLIIKLTAIVTAAITLGLAMPLLAILTFTALFWLQEGIWRTVQGRCSERLLIVEKLIKEQAEGQGMQFYSEWERSRSGTIGTVVEYLRHSIRPTVAYPYAILMLLELLLMFWI